MDNNQNVENEIDLTELFFTLLGKLWTIFLTTIVGVIAAVLVTTFCMEPVYSSTSMLYILTKTTNFTSLEDLQLGTKLTKDYMVFITSRPVVDKVIENLDLDMAYCDFIANVKVDNLEDTRILNITVNNRDPYMAKTIVDELTEVSAEHMAEIMETDRPKVADYGHVSQSQTSPVPLKNALMGGLAGFVISCAIIILAYLMDDSIRTSEDIERYLNVSTLGMIPLTNDEEKLEKKKRSLKSKLGEDIKWKK